MKIDEKIVTYFESCNSPVDKEGFLYKKGEIKTSYQKRWFVLKGNLLFYKDRPADRDPIGVIVLEGCTVQLFSQNLSHCTVTRVCNDLTLY
uniref:PH domain-containing protein n=1 Tax=Lates calcarifer TaxID=8187 RepID=A0A4W6CN82_LATCA